MDYLTPRAICAGTTPLRAALLAAGSTAAQYSLFELLTQYSLVAVPKQGLNGEVSTPLFDMRAGQALLVLFPVNVQALLAYVLTQEEQLIVDHFEGTADFDGFDLLDSRKTAGQLLELSGAAIQLRVSPYLVGCMAAPLPVSHLLYLLGMGGSLSLDGYLRDKLDSVFEVCNYSSPLVEPYKDVATNGDRVSAAQLLCGLFSYGSTHTRAITGIVETWIHGQL